MAFLVFKTCLLCLSLCLREQEVPQVSFNEQLYEFKSLLASLTSVFSGDFHQGYETFPGGRWAQRTFCDFVSLVDGFLLQGKDVLGSFSRYIRVSPIIIKTVLTRTKGITFLVLTLDSDLMRV